MNGAGFKLYSCHLLPDCFKAKLSPVFRSENVVIPDRPEHKDTTLRLIKSVGRVIAEPYTRVIDSTGCKKERWTILRAWLGITSWNRSEARPLVDKYFSVHSRSFTGVFVVDDSPKYRESLLHFAFLYSHLKGSNPSTLINFEVMPQIGPLESSESGVGGYNQNSSPARNKYVTLVLLLLTLGIAVFNLHCLRSAGEGRYRWLWAVLYGLTVFGFAISLGFFVDRITQ